MRFQSLFLPLFALPLMHCAMLLPQAQQTPGEPTEAGGAPQTTSAGYAPSSRASEPGPSTASPLAKQAAPAAPAAHVPTSVEIHSDCAKTTPVFYGDKPKFGSGTRSSIGSNTTTTTSRRPDGTLTVWIIDDHENGIASAQVGPTTRRVEIDRSCRQITAR